MQSTAPLLVFISLLFFFSTAFSAPITAEKLIGIWVSEARDETASETLYAARGNLFLTFHTDVRI